jgi:hemoglobin
MKKTSDGLYEQIGGMQTCLRLSERFHQRVAEDPVLKPLFPAQMDQVTERLALFLAEQTGGPAAYTAKRGKQSLLCRHARLPVGAREREAWLGHMFAAMEEEQLPESAQRILRAYFEETSSSLSDPFLPFYSLPLDALQRELQRDPALAIECRHGRSLLIHTAGRWDLPRVEMLLKHGADARVRDSLGHDPLYHAANAHLPGHEAQGRAVIQTLIRHGADVNGRSGPGRLTPLHAAARRGIVAIVEALLSAGAEVNASDSRGATPLQRARNCRQWDAARLLESRMRPAPPP